MFTVYPTKTKFYKHSFVYVFLTNKNLNNEHKKCNNKKLGMVSTDMH